MRIYDKILPLSLYKQIESRAMVLPYKHGWSSANISNYDSFFNHQLVNTRADNRRDITGTLEEPYLSIWQFLQRNCLPNNPVLLRTYVNMQVFGTEAHPHRDVALCYENDLSIVVYCVDHWETQWGGATIEFEIDGSVNGAIVKPNRAVVFNSNKLHQALPISKSCHKPRYVLVFKARPKDPIEDFFIAKDWDKLPHGNSNFAHHLMKCGYQAKLLGASEDVIKAAYFHATLSTPFFTPNNPATIEELSTIISPYSLHLVKQFSMLSQEDRANVTGDLVLIVKANELSQNK